VRPARSSRPCCCSRYCSRAQSIERLHAEVFVGTAWSLPTTLTIRQAGEPAIRVRARWSTRPWRDAPYYAYRVGHASGRGAWEAELVHHKLYLENPPPDVQAFEVTHGYNLAMLDRATFRGRTVVRMGVGLVVAHPEGMVRGRRVGPVRSLLGRGYHIAGATGQLSLGRHVALGRGLYAVPEAKLTATHARVPLAGGGWATVPNVAVHALAGVGYARVRR
jgi:hypothetical protein